MCRESILAGGWGGLKTDSPQEVEVLISGAISSPTCDAVDTGVSAAAV